MPNFIGEILHFNAVRVRVVGVGNLNLSLRSLDDTNEQQITSIPMIKATNREPTQLVNFIDQRAQIFMGTTEINEIFNISKLVIFARPISVEYPR